MQNMRLNDNQESSESQSKKPQGFCITITMVIGPLFCTQMLWQLFLVQHTHRWQLFLVQHTHRCVCFTRNNEVLYTQTVITSVCEKWSNHHCNCNTVKTCTTKQLGLPPHFLTKNTRIQRQSKDLIYMYIYKLVVCRQCSTSLAWLYYCGSHYCPIFHTIISGVSLGKG